MGWKPSLEIPKPSSSSLFKSTHSRKRDKYAKGDFLNFQKLFAEMATITKVGVDLS